MGIAMASSGGGGGSGSAINVIGELVQHVESGQEASCELSALGFSRESIDKCVKSLRGSCFLPAQGGRWPFQHILQTDGSGDLCNGHIRVWPQDPRIPPIFQSL